MKYPVKLLSDMNREPFFPFIISDAVFLNGTNRTVQQELNNRYTIPEIDAMFAALGTVMDFRGVVENEKQLPTATPDTKGDVYVVLHYYESIICHTVINDGTKWIDMGEPLDIDLYYTKEQCNIVIDEKVDARAKTERTITTDAINRAINECNKYTDTQVKEKIEASEKAQREITNTDIANALKEAKSYTDKSISDLHPEEFLTDKIFKEDRTVTGVWTYTTGLKVIKTPSEEYDAVNLKFLEEQVIGPINRLIRRLNGEEV